MHLQPLFPSNDFDSPDMSSAMSLASSGLHPSSIMTMPISNILHTLPLPQNLSTHQIEILSGHLHLIRLVHLSNATCLVLKTVPPPRTPLLRHERAQLANEAAILSRLARSSLPIPRLLKYDASDGLIGSPYLLTSCLPGVPYSTIRQHLGYAERADIEHQLRALAIDIGQYASPTFGPVALVAKNRGFKTWKEAFVFMLEGVLMDAEDMLVSLPFSDIHTAVDKTARTLEEVKEARLLLSGFHEIENVLIERRTNRVSGLLGLGNAMWGDAAWGEETSEKRLL